MKQVLRYGQTIRLHEATTNGMIVAKGFTDQNAYFTKSCTNNYRESLFIILPRGTFELHDEYLKSGYNVNNNLYSRIKSEATQYHVIIQNRMNEEILFGAEVVFKHLDSQHFLYGSYECSQIAMDAFQLKLSRHVSSQTIFKLYPHQTYQQEGQLIFLNEPLTIIHEKSQCKLGYEECTLFLDLTLPLDQVELNTQQYIPIIKRPLKKREEAIIGLNSTTQWQFQLHQDEQGVGSYDLCQFKSTQNNAYLSIDGNRLILKEYKDSDYLPLDSVWEIQNINDKFIIRSQLYGLIVHENGFLVNQLDLQDLPELQIEPAKYGQDQLHYHMFVKIKHQDQELQLTKNFERNSLKRMSSINPQIDRYYVPLSNEDLEYSQYHVNFLDIPSAHGFQITKLSEQYKEDLLFICSSHEILQQFSDVLRLNIQKIEELVDDRVLNQVLRVIKKLIAYILNCDYHELDTCENLPITKRQLYMKDLMIVEIIMQIIYFTWSKNESDKLFEFKRYERDKIRQIYKYSFMLIEKMTKNNATVKLFISQWLKLFLIQAIGVDNEQIQISLFELLDDNYYSINKFIQEETLHNLVELISSKKELHEKYLRIFSSIIICNGRPLIQNQIAILEIFYQAKGRRKEFHKYSFKEIDKMIKVETSFQKWQTLQQFHEESEQNNNLQTWNYFLAYINLLSDICQNRNKYGKEYVTKNYQLQILVSILEDPETEKFNAIEPFLKLIHFAFLDCQAFSPIRRIARVREWAIIEKKTDIIKTKTKIEDDQKRVIIYIQNYIEKFNYFEIKNKNRNKTLYTVLQVLKTTIRLGFWQQISQLKTILSSLFKIVSCVNDINNFLQEGQSVKAQLKNLHEFNQTMEKLTKINQENIIIMQCKDLACEIIDIIFDMETNVRVSLSTIKLKQMISQNKQEDLQEWKNFFNKLIIDRQLFIDELKNIEMRFAELTFFENQSLQTYALKLLNRVHGQRKELLFNFDKTIIVNAGFTHTLSEKSRLTRTKLLSCNDRNILEATILNQQQYNAFLWKESNDNKETGVIQDLRWLIECLKQGDEIKIGDVKINYNDIYPKNQLRLVYTERETNFKLHQSLIKCQDLHENIIMFIQIATECDKKELIMKTLFTCYQYLTMLIWNHQENKHDFNSVLEKCYHHIQYNVYCIQYLRELFLNNKVLLFNEIKCTKTIQLVVSICNQIDFEDYHKAQLMDFLRVLTLFNNKSIKINQNLIMANLQDRLFKNLMLLFKKDSLLNQIDKLIEDYQIEYSKALNNVQISINISPQLSYIFNYFQLMSMLISDKNEINIGKCKQMHPHKKLLLLYQQIAQCWPLKRYLRSYINRLYYCGEGFFGITQNLIEIDIENIVSDIRDIVELKETQTDFDKVEIQNPTRYQYMSSYLYLTLEENLIALQLVFDSQTFRDELQDTLHHNYSILKFKLHLELIEIAILLQKVWQLWNNCTYFKEFIKILMGVLYDIFKKTFDLQMLILHNILQNSLQMKKIEINTMYSFKRYQNGQLFSEEQRIQNNVVDPKKILQNKILQLTQEFDDPNEIVDNDKIDQLKEKILQEICDFEGINNSVKKDIIQYNQQNNRRQSSETDNNEVLNQMHRKLMIMFTENKEFNNFIEEEFYRVCQQLQKIGEQGKQMYNTLTPMIQLKDFIQNIIQLNLKHYDTLSEDLKIFFLKVLENIITGKNEKQTKTIEQWEPDYWGNHKKEIEEAQNFLEECGAAELICKFLRCPALELRLSLSNQLISFGIAFLLGGNTKCQNSILQKLKLDNQNLMLNNYRQMIKRISRAVYNNFKFRRNKTIGENKFQVRLYDTFDFYDQKQQIMISSNLIKEEDDLKEIQIKLQFVQLFNRSFRFLQLLCENNNINMKNFIRQQIDSEGNQKIGSINFIELATSQLRIYFKAFNEKIIDVPNFILDFIVEVVQVPCLDNQITLCKTTFFEDVCYLVQLLSSEDNLTQRMLLQEDAQKQLQAIYNKILIAIMSVLEGNDDRIFDDLQHKIEPKFLIEIITQYLKLLGVKTKQDMEEILTQQELLFSDEIVKILNVLIIKEKITSEKFDFDKEAPQNIQQIMDLLQKKILKIEIIYQNKPQTILFPNHPLFSFLSDQTRDTIMYRVNRETQRDKIIGILEYKNQIHNELEYNYKLSKKRFPITSKSIIFLRQLAAIFSLLVNILMVLQYNIEISNYQVNLIAEFHEQIMINMLSFCQLLTSIIYYIFYLISRLPLCLREQDHEQVDDENINQIQPIIENEIIMKESTISLFKKRQSIMSSEIQLLTQSLSFKLVYYFMKQLKSCQQKLIHMNKKVQTYYNWIGRIFVQIQNVISNEDGFLQITFYLFCAILGTFYKSYFFSLHLFDLISRLTLLNNVFQAISYNAKQLIVVSMLGVLFIYVFSFTSFDQYADDIYTENQPEEHCETLLSCMITLVTSGVIGNSMLKWDFVKFCYDTLYFVFFALLFTNIISGIMIDTFAELRDQRQKIDDDKNNCCFVCGAKRTELEKNLENFGKHVKDKHFLWNYIYYMYCLMKKDSTEYTGLEYSISEMISKEDISWYPI